MKLLRVEVDAEKVTDCAYKLIEVDAHLKPVGSHIGYYAVRDDKERIISERFRLVRRNGTHRDCLIGYKEPVWISPAEIFLYSTFARGGVEIDAQSSPIYEKPTNERQRVDDLLSKISGAGRESREEEFQRLLEEMLDRIDAALKPKSGWS